MEAEESQMICEIQKESNGSLAFHPDIFCTFLQNVLLDEFLDLYV